jgi:hypothetical protein
VLPGIHAETAVSIQVQECAGASREGTLHRAIPRTRTGPAQAGSRASGPTGRWENRICNDHVHLLTEDAAARRFYERHGYIAVAFSDGSGNEERCPDVLYEWVGAGAAADN